MGGRRYPPKKKSRVSFFFFVCAFCVLRFVTSVFVFCLGREKKSFVFLLLFTVLVYHRYPKNHNYCHFLFFFEVGEY